MSEERKEDGRVRGVGRRAIERVRGGVVERVSSLDLLEREHTRRLTRKGVELYLRGIKVDPLPQELVQENGRAVLVSNYPGIYKALLTVMKIGASLPGKEWRLKGVGRPEVVEEANLLLKALGVDKKVFTVEKDGGGAYRMEGGVLKEVLAHLDEPGKVLWMSPTGKRKGNGLLEGDLRTGAALFAVKKDIPIVPMGMVTGEEKGKLRVVKVRFGRPIYPEAIPEPSEFEKGDFLSDLIRLAACEIASVLPLGQRGDFENYEERREGVCRRLRIDPQGFIPVEGAIDRGAV